LEWLFLPPTSPIVKVIAEVCFGAIVLKNSLVRLLAAIFVSQRPAPQLFIALLDNSANRSFVVYRFPDFFNNTGHQHAFPRPRLSARCRFGQDGVSRRPRLTLG